ncbi:MAG TPA: hypothetical protein VMD31_09760, partial [Opitutaceae bacterium]|nr:hypothetical protein [Opitutaceae bacterium]
MATDVRFQWLSSLREREVERQGDLMAYKDMFTVLVVDSRIERSQSLRDATPRWPASCWSGAERRQQWGSQTKEGQVVRHFHPRAYGAMVGAVVLTILVAACTSATSSSGQPAQALAPGWQGLNPGTGAPQYGGILNMVGVSDVAVMDYDIGYYRTDFQVLRLT